MQHQERNRRSATITDPLGYSHSLQYAENLLIPCAMSSSSNAYCLLSREISRLSDTSTLGLSVFVALIAACLRRWLHSRTAMSGVLGPLPNRVCRAVQRMWYFRSRHFIQQQSIKCVGCDRPRLFSSVPLGSEESSSKRKLLRSERLRLRWRPPSELASPKATTDVLAPPPTAIVAPGLSLGELLGQPALLVNRQIELLNIFIGRCPLGRRLSRKA